MGHQPFFGQSFEMLDVYAGVYIRVGSNGDSLEDTASPEDLPEDQPRRKDFHENFFSRRDGFFETRR